MMNYYFELQSDVFDVCCLPYFSIHHSSKTNGITYNKYHENSKATPYFYREVIFFKCFGEIAIARAHSVQCGFQGSIVVDADTIVGAEMLDRLIATMKSIQL